MATDSMTSSQLEELLGDNANTLLEHKCTTIDSSMLHLPGPDFNERIVAESDRSAQVMRNLQQMWDHGRLGGTGYLSILPVDQGIEHSAGASFAPNPEYFDPGKIVELAPVEQMVDAPRHPYSRGLLASTVHDGMRGQRLEAIPGAPPDLAEVPTGCSFAPRCKFVEPACVARPPDLREMGGSHLVRCVLADAPKADVAA